MACISVQIYSFRNVKKHPQVYNRINIIMAKIVQVCSRLSLSIMITELQRYFDAIPSSLKNRITKNVLYIYPGSSVSIFHLIIFCTCILQSSEFFQANSREEQSGARVVTNYILAIRLSFITKDNLSHFTINKQIIIQFDNSDKQTNKQKQTKAKSGHGKRPTKRNITII